MKNKLLIATSDPLKFEKMVRSHNLPDLEILVATNEQEIEEQIWEVNILLTNPLLSNGFIHLWEKLDWVQSTFAGIDSLCKTWMKRDYVLTNVKDTYGVHMSEHVFAYILMLEKRLLHNFEKQKNKHWEREPYPSIHGKTIAILGTGSIGKVIAKIAKAFGMRTLWYNLSWEAVEYFDEIYTPENKKTCFEQADYLLSVLPDTPKTHHTVDAEALSWLKDSAYFINVGRGSNVDEEALISSLNSWTIAWAILDVFQVEPLPQESPLWTMENVYISTHVSGYVEDNSRLVEIFVNNYKKFHAGEQLDYLIDFERGF